MEGSGGSRKIVEVFIETDSESESYCSSEYRGETTETALEEEDEQRTKLLSEEVGEGQSPVAAEGGREQQYTDENPNEGKLYIDFSKFCIKDNAV